MPTKKIARKPNVHRSTSKTTSATRGGRTRRAVAKKSPQTRATAKKVTQPTWATVARKIRAAFNHYLPMSGVKNGRVIMEPIHGTRLHRVLVVASGFSRVPHWDRQDMVWRALRDLTSREQALISMIVPLSPKELY